MSLLFLLLLQYDDAIQVDFFDMMSFVSQHECGDSKHSKNVTLTTMTSKPMNQQPPRPNNFESASAYGRDYIPKLIDVSTSNLSFAFERNGTCA